MNKFESFAKILILNLALYCHKSSFSVPWSTEYLSYKDLFFIFNYFRLKCCLIHLYCQSMENL